MKAFLLVDALPAHAADVEAWLRSLPEVEVLHVVHYGHFAFLAEIVGPSHASVQVFVTNKVRHHKGVEMIREVDEGQVPAILASEDRPAGGLGSAVPG